MTSREKYLMEEIAKKAVAAATGEKKNEPKKVSKQGNSKDNIKEMFEQHVREVNNDQLG